MPAGTLKPRVRFMRSFCRAGRGGATRGYRWAMVLGDGLAMPPGTDASTLTRYLHQAHDDFVQTGQIDRAS